METLKSGWMLMKKKQSNSYKNQHFFVLEEGVLYFYKNETTTKPLGSISLSQSQIKVKNTPNNTEFQIITEKKIFFFQTNSSEKQLEWITALNSQSKLKKLNYILDRLSYNIIEAENRLASLQIQMFLEGKETEDIDENKSQFEQIQTEDPLLSLFIQSELKIQKKNQKNFLENENQNENENLDQNLDKISIQKIDENLNEIFN
ncbi:dual adapter for phosphotyrosine and 3-phosphotyrosine and 3-phosphoinositide [Anaeramoeba ignava]|uniref:Dual adapter for phosphotyrosine and 3-phosphotyrosine and 3-phosphoinositide n=1 Tax=Anaeramoeba ignava TaxID=1746090 RepID=A0A9Q0L8Q2_ANAIG|nr:dual adapter for phosphotyrosine and 3-phosphotyrosine and 3-phosphoinositide [Anaeramoeba ignava]